MFIVGLLGWWYGAGWRATAARTGERIIAMVDFFSIDLLLVTLFAPFRQISAGRVRGPLGVQLRAFSDRLVSRLIGALVRAFMIIAGSVALGATVGIGFIMLVGWALLPLLPVAGVVMSIAGWPAW
jgi:hypothetical protein